jgi:hypothetical protein
MKRFGFVCTHSFFSRIAAVLAAAALLVAAEPAKANPSYSGINIPWLVGGSTGMNYGHDFKSGSYDATFAHNVLNDLHNHQQNIVRVWLFEGLQGLNMSGSSINSVDSTFLNNVDDFVSWANGDGIDVEVVCFNYLDIANNPSMITNSTNQTSMVNACKAVASKLGGNHRNYQMDLCNEGNLAITNGITWTNFHNFIYNACSACHSVSGAWVTMSDQNANDFSSGNFYNTVGGVGCDYYEFHQYAESASLLSSVPDGKKLELGEYGPPSNSSGQNVDGSNLTDWSNVINSFQNAVAANGNYYSLMAWCYFPDGQSYQLTDGNFTWNNAGWSVQWWGQHYGF